LLFLRWVSLLYNSHHFIKFQLSLFLPHCPNVLFIPTIPTYSCICLHHCQHDEKHHIQIKIWNLFHNQIYLPQREYLQTSCFIATDSWLVTSILWGKEIHGILQLKIYSDTNFKSLANKWQNQIYTYTGIKEHLGTICYDLQYQRNPKSEMRIAERFYTSSQKKDKWHWHSHNYTCIEKTTHKESIFVTTHYDGGDYI